MIWLLPHFFSIWSQCVVVVVVVFFQILQRFPFALRTASHVLNMAYKTLNYLTPKDLPVLPHSMLPLTVSLSATPTFFIIQDMITTPKCQPLKSTKAHWLLSSCGSSMYQQWQEVHWSGEESMANYVLALGLLLRNGTHLSAHSPLARAGHVSMPPFVETEKHSPACCQDDNLSQHQGIVLATFIHMPLNTHDGSS